MNSKNQELLQNGNLLLEVAKNAINEKLNNVLLINKDELLEAFALFSEQRATFVTLNLNGALRGCIGSLLPQRNLLDDIICNAKAAAFDDPRFLPLNQNEFENVDIEISILTLPEVLDYDDISDLKRKIRVGKDGVILKSGVYQATFLPQVWEQLPLFETFFSHLCQKAGLDVDCLNEHPEIYTYNALKVK